MQLVQERYELRSELGQGGMGLVYRAYDRLTGQLVALKRVTAPTRHLEFTATTATANLPLALAREFRTLARLRHPNIISVLDYGFDSQTQPFYTMELLLDALTITNYAEDLESQEKLKLILQMAQALQYLHRNGILHRDLKPDNVMVVDGNVKVLDFGLAIGREFVNSEDDPVGTMRYMAPEQLSGDVASIQSDLYAFGVLVHEIFIGKHPYEADMVVKIIQRTLNEEFDAATLPLDERLKGALAKLLAKSPRKRFGRIDEFLALFPDELKELDSPVIQESFLRAAQFVGREQELSKIKTSLGELQAGQSHLWLVGGESGVGKSRLLDEIRTQALLDNILVLRGQAIAEASAPYQLWRDVLRVLVLHCPVSNEEARVLRLLIPDLERILNRLIPEPPKLEPQAFRSRLLSIMTRMFQALNRPLLLLLEDMHWASSEVPILQELIKVSHQQAMLIVATYRDDEAPELAELLHEMDYLHLNRLNGTEIEALSASMLGENSQNAALQELLQRETEGNAFFIVEVMRALIDLTGNIGRIGGDTVPAKIFAKGIQAVIQERLNRVPEQYRPLLQIAAVIGRKIDTSLMTHLAEDKQSLVYWLNVCAAASVFEADGDSWRFSHDRLREAILNELVPVEQQSIHQRVAEAIEAVYPLDESYLVRLAYHWQYAQNPAKEAIYSFMAGKQALENGLYPNAKRFLERTLELSSQLENPPHSSILRLYLGEVAFSMGVYELAEQRLTEGIQIAEMQQDFLGLARSYNLLGNIHLARGDLEKAEEHLRHSIAIGQERRDLLEVGKSTRVLGLIYETRSDYSQAKTHFEAALQYLSDAEDDMGVAGALGNLAGLARHEDDFVQARRLYEQALERFEGIGFAWGIAYTLTNLALVLDKLGEENAATDAHSRAIQICRDIQHRWGLALSLGNRAKTQMQQKQFENANQSLKEAVLLAQAIQTFPLLMDLLATYAALLAAQGLIYDALELLLFVMARDETEELTRTEYLAMLHDLELLVDTDELTNLQIRVIGAKLETFIKWLL